MAGMGTTADKAAKFVGMSKQARPATSGNKHVVTGGPQSSARSQSSKVAGVVRANLKGPYAPESV